MIQPIQPRERIEVLDIVRGFALFGVLLVNMASFKGLLLFPVNTPTEFSSILDQMAAWFIQLFGVAKFYTIFSFMFGLGFYIFMDRALQKELNAKKLFRRRLLFLFLLGIIHLCFVWSGDILHTYAIGGLFLTAFWNKKPDTIKKWIIFFIIFSVVLLSGLLAIQYMTINQVPPELFQSQHEYLRQASMDIYQSGSYLEIFQYRLMAEAPTMLINNLASVLMVLPLFLMGLYVGKKGIISNLLLYGQQIKKVFYTTLIVGGFLTLLIIIFILNPMRMNNILALGIKEIIIYLAGITMSFFYITGIIILLLKGWLNKLLKSLAYTGRMALTNYLLQSLVATLIFYNYGLGLFGKVGPFVGMIFTVVIFSVQVLLSKFWLLRYNYGPVEWLWRRFTYGKAVELHRAVN